MKNFRENKENSNSLKWSKSGYSAEGELITSGHSLSCEFKSKCSIQC